ncbi:MAG: outer membrane protein assembly factor BamE [Comamonadaceae bacterium]|nr:MAG: outer membrane protein assembly factor BamE [Comamonadaceae bacterium]
MTFIQTLSTSHLLMAGCMLACASAVSARENPVDPVSNPSHLVYGNVETRSPDFGESFLRDGVVSQTAGFARIAAGLPAAEVASQLGEPLRKGSGAHGQEWDYNFKFRLSPSNNYMVCQYKVVFDDSKNVVRETAWRRKQCLDLVTQAGAGPR